VRVEDVGGGIGDGSAVDVDAQPLGAVVGIAADASVGEADAPDREELAQRERERAVGLDMDDPA
jgi:hypothetical protein